MSITEVAPEPVIAPESRGNEAPKPSTKSIVLNLLRRTQRYSAYGFAGFAALHLFSTAVAPALSLSAAHSSFMFARAIYQSTLGEPLLVYGTLGAHLLSGVALHAYKVYSARRYYGKWISGVTALSASGGLLSILVTGHWLVNRGAPLVVLGDSSLISLDYISWALDHDITKSGFFLFLIVMTYSYHAVAGFAKWQRIKLGYKLPLLLATLAAFCATSLSALARAPVPGGWIASQYEAVHDYAESWM